MVTHRGCLDGTGSALMFLWAGGRGENILFRAPSTCNLSVDEVSQFDEVWFADLCPKARDGLTLSASNVAGGKPFHVFDHHASNARAYADDPHCTFSMVHSGTSLLGEMTGVYDAEWSKLYSDDELDGWKHDRFKLVSALEAYDLGKFSHTGGVFLADLASSFSQENMLDLLKLHGCNIFCQSDLRGRVEALASMRTIFSDSATRNVLVKDLDGIRCGVALSPVYWKNEVAQRILAQGFDMAVILEPAGMISLRSLEGGPDCSIIAGRYGGGGHPRAAGFKYNPHTMADAAFEQVFG